MWFNGFIAVFFYIFDTTSDIHISTLSGKSASVNGYCWIHKGAVIFTVSWTSRRLVKFWCKLIAYSSPLYNILLSFLSSLYVDLFMSYIELLKSNNIQPIVVFDRLPNITSNSYKLSTCIVVLESIVKLSCSSNCMYSGLSVRTWSTYWFTLW